MTPKVSVIVPVYNTERYIEKCANALFQQTLNDIEFIFVNDCSTDNSITVLMNILQIYPQRKNQVTIINQAINLGPSSTRNLGLLNATGQYVIFCDSDDYVDLDAYESMYNTAICNNADIVACGIEVVDINSIKTKSLLFGDTIIDWKDCLNDFNKLEGGIYSSMCNKLFRREFLLTNNIFFDESTKMWEDLYTTIKARYLAKRIHIIDMPYYHYCLHSGSIIHSNVISRVNSQVKVVKLIESFFEEQHCAKEHALLLAYLKFLSKELLIETNPKLWVSLFPEANKYIHRLSSYYGKRTVLKYMLLANTRGLGCLLFRIVRFIKHKMY